MLLEGSYEGDAAEFHADNCQLAESQKWIPNETPYRVISCVIYLNNASVDFTGGELVFRSVSKAVSPRAGLFVAYPSNERFEHEVRPVLSGARYSILLWFTEDSKHAAGPFMPQLRSGTVATGRSRRLILKHHLSPGDVLMMTAAVRDLQLSHPGKFLIDVDTPFPQIWENNPYLTRFKPEDTAEVMPMHYPLIHESNESPYHFIHGFRLYLETQLNVRIKATRFRGDLLFLARRMLETEHDTLNILPVGTRPSG